MRTLKSPRCPESLGVAQRPRSPQVEATELAFTEDFPFPAQSGRRNVGVQLSLSVASATCGKLSPSGRGGLGRRAAVSSRAGVGAGRGAETLGAGGARMRPRRFPVPTWLFAPRHFADTCRERQAGLCRWPGHWRSHAGPASVRTTTLFKCEPSYFVCRAGNGLPVNARTALPAAPGRPPWSPRASRLGPGNWRERRGPHSRRVSPGTCSMRAPHTFSITRVRACAARSPAFRGLSHTPPARGALGVRLVLSSGHDVPDHPPGGARRRPGGRGGDAAWALVTHGQFVWCMDRDEALPEAGCRRLDHRSENEPAWLLKCSTTSTDGFEIAQPCKRSELGHL